MPNTKKRKKVLVIGAGPAGMELAGLAAERGHDVTLWEKAGVLGGQVALSSKVRMNANYGKWVTFQEWRLAEAGVKIEMNKSADVEAVLAFADQAVAVLASLQEEPLASTVIPLADLGSYPMNQLADAYAFDHYCHLRIDLLAPDGPIERKMPDADATRLAPAW